MIEILIGRSIAAVIHPVAAWRSSRRGFRVLLLASYLTVGYAAVLAVLILLG